MESTSRTGGAPKVTPGPKPRAQQATSGAPAGQARSATSISDEYSPEELEAAKGPAKNHALRVGAQLGESLFAAAKAHLEASPAGEPIDPRALADEATAHILGDPKMQASVNQALPAFEGLAAAAVGTGAVGLATTALPRLVAGEATSAVLANRETVQNLLRVGHRFGGSNGRRLVAAALRGLQAGVCPTLKNLTPEGAKRGLFQLNQLGFSRAAAEVSRQCQKIGLEGVPGVGNAVAMVSTGYAVRGLLKAHQQGCSKAMRLAHEANVALSVIGCFFRPAAILAPISLTVGRIYEDCKEIFGNTCQKPSAPAHEAVHEPVPASQPAPEPAAEPLPEPLPL
jgi:hypothetical protein